MQERRKIYPRNIRSEDSRPCTPVPRQLSSYKGLLWITLGEKTAQVALHYGASDTDGTIIRERIIHDTGAPSEVGHSRDFMVNMIKNAGYTPVERDALYNVALFNN